MTPAETLNLELRPMAEDDRNYVLSSWLRSYADAREFSGMTRPSFFAMYESTVKALMERSIIAVAAMPEAPGVVLGWMAIEGDHLHYVLTKPRWRKLGIARFLLADLKDQAVRYTHQPPMLAPIPGAWSYDPVARFRKAAP